MEKMQVLFPKPQLDRLRRLARDSDRPVSELVRAAVDAWLSRQADTTMPVHDEPPVYSLGAVKADPHGPTASLRSTHTTREISRTLTGFP